MKKLILSTCLSIFICTIFLSNAKAGDLAAFDAEGQFVGYVVSRILKENVQNMHVYIPSLNINAYFELWESNYLSDGTMEIIQKGKMITNGTLRQDISGELYLNAPGTIAYLDDCEGFRDSYFISGTAPQAVMINKEFGPEFDQLCHIIVWEPPNSSILYKAIEIPASEMPFTLPLKLPIEFRYFDKADALTKGDTNFDGVVDGQDLAIFANQFGE